MKLRNFVENQQGIILPLTIAISFTFLFAITWLVGALIVNRTFDAFQPWFAAADPRALVTAQSAVNAYGVSIVITLACLWTWAGLSAQKRESQESAAIPY